MLAGVVVDERRVALAERAAPGVLAGEAHGVALEDQRAERQRLGGGPVDLVLGLELLLAAPRTGLASFGCGVKPSG